MRKSILSVKINSISKKKERCAMLLHADAFEININIQTESYCTNITFSIVRYTPGVVTIL